MSTDVERLIVSLEARTRAFENALNRANGVANRRTKAIEGRFAAMNRNISGGFVGLSRSLTRAFAVAGGVRGLQLLLDASTRMENALKVTGLAGQDLTRVYDKLFASAQRNLAPVDALVDLYSRLGISQSELGVTTDQMADFTDRVALALRVQGTTATEARGALIQLGQAMGEGVFRAQEFNSIIEQAPAIHRAAAAGLKEANGSVAELRRIMLDGRLSSRAYFDALLAGAEILEDKVKDAQITTTQGITLIRNEMINAVGDFARGSLAAEGLGDAFKQMAEAINGVDFQQFGEQIGELLAWIEDLREAMGFLQSLGVNLGRVTGLDRVGDTLTGGDAQKSFFGGAFTITNQRGLQRRIDEAFGNAVDTAGALTEQAIIDSANRSQISLPGSAPLPTSRPSGITPVSLDDYEVPAGAAGAGGGKGGGRSRANGYQREVEQIRERTDALRAETAAMAGVNPLIDDFDYAITKASAAQELLNGAKKAGLTVTPQLQASIDELAEGYARATVEANQLAYAQDNARRAAEEMRELGKDVMGGFISDLRAGKSASEALANALQKVADKLLEVALNSIFDAKPGGGGGGFLGGLFGSIGKIFGFSKGTANTGGRRGETRGVVHGQEAVIPLPAGGKVPVQINAPSPSLRGSGETVRVVLQDDSGRMAEIADQRIQTSAGTIIQVSVQQSTRAVKAGLPSMIANAQTREM